MPDDVKAIVAKVQFGTFEIDGLLFEDGSYEIAIPQVASLFLDSQMRASQTLKRLMGMDFKTHKSSPTEPFSETVGILAGYGFPVPPES